MHNHAADDIATSVCPTINPDLWHLDLDFCGGRRSQSVAPGLLERNIAHHVGCGGLEARAEAEELAQVSAECAALADGERKVFQTEAAAHKASQLEAWKHSEQHQHDTEDFC